MICRISEGVERRFHRNGVDTQMPADQPPNTRLSVPSGASQGAGTASDFDERACPDRASHLFQGGNRLMGNTFMLVSKRPICT